MRLIILRPACSGLREETARQAIVKSIKETEKKGGDKEK
jgi:hypothetical protein